MKRILQVNIDNNGGNGAYTLVNYYYEELKNDYIFDFFTMNKFIDTADYRCILSRGGLCYSANLRNNRFIGHLMLPFVFKKTFQNNIYEVVHIHSEVAYKVLLYAFIAKISGIKKIIVHSHSSCVDGDYIFLKKILHKFCKLLLPFFTNIYVACSEDAANWMFDKKIIKKGNYTILKNGIIPRQFLYDDDKRFYWRKKLKINDNDLLIGHVGALKPVKNQSFILDILANLYCEYSNIKLLLVGNGTDMRKLKDKASSLGIQANTIFFGNSDKVNELYNAMDLLLFPSLFEGVPMTLIESQASGLPILASSVITPEVKVTDLITFENLKSNVDVWINDIKEIMKKNNNRTGYNSIIESSDFNIRVSAKKLAYIYG